MVLTTPQAGKMHVAVFGRKNAGKTSLINALNVWRPLAAGREAERAAESALTSGELERPQPIVFLDTCGIDDITDLSRFQANRETMDRADLALLIFSDESGTYELEKAWYGELDKRNIPVIGVINKVDDHYVDIGVLKMELDIPFVKVSAKRNINLGGLRHAIHSLAPAGIIHESVIGELVRPGGLAVLVMPGEAAAPKNRLCTAQQHVLRNLLDHHAMALTVAEAELSAMLDSLKSSPDLVIAEAGTLQRVQPLLPGNVALATFSMLQGVI